MEGGGGGNQQISDTSGSVILQRSINPLQPFLPKTIFNDGSHGSRFGNRSSKQCVHYYTSYWKMSAQFTLYSICTFEHVHSQHKLRTYHDMAV